MLKMMALRYQERTKLYSMCSAYESSQVLHPGESVWAQRLEDVAQPHQEPSAL